MKLLQRLCAAIVLASMLTLPTLAGDMDTGMGIAPPPPPPTSSLTQGNVTEAPSGHMPTGPGATSESESYAGVVWGLLEGVLALF